MEFANRAMAAAVCCLAGLLVGGFGLAAFQHALDRRSPPPVPEVSDDEIKMRRISPQANDAIALRTMELLKARERIGELEQQASQRALDYLEANRQLSQLQAEVTELRQERNDSLDLVISLLSDPTLTSAPPAEVETPRPEPSTPVVSDGLRDLERLLEIEQLRAELDEMQLAINAMQAQQAVVVTALRDDWERSENAALRVVSAAGASAVPALITQLESDQPTVRRWAARALRTLGLQALDAVPSLRLALSDPDETVRREVEAALRAIRD